MKKLIALLLMVTVLLVCASCGVPEDTPIGSAGSTDGTPPTQMGQEIGSTTAPTEGTEGTKATEPTKNDVVTLEESVIYDKNGVKITIKGLTEGWSGPDIKVLVENNSDKNIVFSGDEFVVNGVTISGSAYIDVAAGKKANGTITLYSTELEDVGIGQIATVQGMDCHVLDSDSYETLFNVPFSVETSISKDHVQEIDYSGDVLFEKAGIKVIAKKLREDWSGYSVLLLVKNDTGKDVIVEAENISVNGFTISGWLVDTVYADTVRLCDISLLSTELEDNEIKDIESVTFSLNIIDSDTYDRIAKSDEIGITVK